MTTLDGRERIAPSRRGHEKDDQWRREMLSRIDRLESKVDGNQRWTIGLLVVILIAIIGSNWLG